MIISVEYASGAVINLNDNKLTAFVQGVFKSILDYFVSNSFTSNVISVTKSKSINYCHAIVFPPKIGCGSESWLVGQSAYFPLITGGICGDADATAFSALTTGICLCPPSPSLSPCTCGMTVGSVSTDWLEALQRNWATRPLPRFFKASHQRRRSTRSS